MIFGPYDMVHIRLEKSLELTSTSLASSNWNSSRQQSTCHKQNNMQLQRDIRSWKLYSAYEWDKSAWNIIRVWMSEPESGSDCPDDMAQYCMVHDNLVPKISGPTFLSWIVQVSMKETYAIYDFRFARLAINFSNSWNLAWAFFLVQILSKFSLSSFETSLAALLLASIVCVLLVSENKVKKLKKCLSVNKLVKI